MNPTDEKYSLALQRILQIMNELREQCPWDRKQTIQSLRHLTIEETYELSDAILGEDWSEIKNELGDILLHIIFYAKIASENQEFDIADVIHTLAEKLIRRHPHIYGNVKAEDEEAVKRNWEVIKLQEKNGKAMENTVLGGVPKSLPAMVKAMRIQEKARGVGFDWDNRQQVWAKVEEELGEFEETYQNLPDEQIDRERAEEEFGDLIFALINYARFMNINPETALEKTNRKFIKRFNYLETESKKDGKQLQEMTLEEMDKYWEKAKKSL
ncbi:MAG: nucleoside triphosphate pyrophosphohydrolase [Thermoflexibacter sp.]|jgi:XTP/dITP diphosphohydrolase|nr:nucleoside triphosphate pyrophosphohydrolase [Thermoflexibacter sp.]